MKIRLLNSLKLQMPWLVIVGVIPLTTVVFFDYSGRAAPKIGREVQANMALKANMLAELVSQWELANTLALQNLSQQPELVSMEPRRQKPLLSKLTQTYKHLYLAMVMDREGMNLARSDSSPLQNYGDRAYFLGALAGENITRQTLISRTNKRPAVCMATPIRREQLETLGVAAICSHLETISHQLGQIKFGQTGYVLMVDRAGRILAHPNSAYIAGDQLRDLSSYAPVQHLLEGREGNFVFEDSHGINWVSYGKRLENGWGILILQQEGELLSSQKDVQNLALVVTALTALSISILVWLLANHLIGPITDLTEATTAIARGQWHQRVAITSSSEVGLLANSFNQMTEQVENSVDQLEAQIKERTAQLKEAKEAAERANQAKDRFIANITHELRTPLHGILGYAKLLRRELRLTSRQREEFKLIERNGWHLLTLINELLDLAQNQVNQLELHPRSLNLPEFLTNVMGMVKPEAQEKGLEMKLGLDNVPNNVLADETRLQQLLINLLSNALKFTERGRVTLRVRGINEVSLHQGLPQQKIRFEVIDTGVGISPPEQAKIFQPFEQAGDVSLRSRGTGLGLAISQQLVELMGGQLQVTSQLGQGSNFWFETVFTLVEENTAVVPQPLPREKQLRYKGRQRQILVVDDREENRWLLVKLLSPLGFKVLTAENGEQMFDVLARERPDLICLDLFMPNKTGFTSAKELRQRPEYQNIPLIVLSSSTITKDIYHYLPCDEFLSQPVNEEKLLELLQQYLHLEWVERTQEQVPNGR